jgi:hypothetical protein
VKIGVWYAVSARRIVVHVLFNERVHCKRCVQVIRRQFFPELTEVEILYGWFQQDSGIAHTAHIALQAVSDVFGNRIISSGIWSERSPDLDPCELFFWDCLKDKIYNRNPRTEELKENIRRKMQIFP